MDEYLCQPMEHANMVALPGRRRIEQLGSALLDISPGELVSLRAP
jgi:hypothetical protein